MMMERLRWLVAVLVAFVAGWVGHAVYGGSAGPTAALSSVTPVPVAPTPDPVPKTEVTIPTTPAASTVASTEASPPDVEPDRARRDMDEQQEELIVRLLVEQGEHGMPLRVPVDPDALNEVIERMNADWFAAYHAEPIDAAWATQTEAQLRQALLTHRNWRGSQLESVECRSKHCVLTVLRGIVLPAPAPAGVPQISPLLPGLQEYHGPPTRVAGETRVFRQQLILTRPPSASGG